MTTGDNQYSSTSFELFLRPIPPAKTQREIDFLTRQLPLPRFAKILDLCCGEGRHAGELAARGYDVTGIDANEQALSVARQRIGSAARWLCGDMRNLSTLTNDRFDAALCLWQSFGYFDEPTNLNILRSMRESLSPNGRLLLDLYNRDFFQANQGTREIESRGTGVIDGVIETKSLVGRRLRVRLDYEGPRAPDQFDWELFTADELRDLAASLGLNPILACSGFDETSNVSARVPRMQLVFDATPIR